MTARYLNPEDLPSTGVVWQIRAIEREVIDGRPRLVLYFHEHERGLVLTRELVEEISQVLGRSPMVDAFFADEGAVH